MTLKLRDRKPHFRLLAIAGFTALLSLGIFACSTAPAGRNQLQKPIEQVVEELKRELNSGAGIQWRGVTEILAMKQAGVDFILVRVSGTAELDNSGIPHLRDGYRIIVEYLGLPTKPKQ